jgi:hypothetical protein
VALAVLDSVFLRKGLTFSVEIARQGGKDELSAQLELLLLTLHMAESKNLVKCSPTFKPQTIISMTRLKDRLNDAGFNSIWVVEIGSYRYAMAGDFSHPNSVSSFKGNIPENISPKLAIFTLPASTSPGRLRGKKMTISESSSRARTQQLLLLANWISLAGVF